MLHVFLTNRHNFHCLDRWDCIYTMNVWRHSHCVNDGIWPILFNQIWLLYRVLHGVSNLFSCIWGWVPVVAQAGVLRGVFWDVHWVVWQNCSWVNNFRLGGVQGSSWVWMKNESGLYASCMLCIHTSLCMTLISGWLEWYLYETQFVLLLFIVGGVIYIGVFRGCIC